MPDATVYGAGFAELYDLFHGSKPYRAEAQFVRDVAGRDRVRLIDVACGTGSHAIELSRLGFDVTGVDGSDPMLLQARRKARQAGQNIRFERQEMTRLSFSGQRWDVVTCLFD